jgi:hypothetical protein
MSKYDSEAEPYKATWRTKWKCIWCHESIPKGEEHWRYSGYWEGDKQNWGMHLDCFKVFQVRAADDDCEIDPGGHKRGSLEWRDAP